MHSRIALIATALVIAFQMQTMPVLASKVAEVQTELIATRTMAYSDSVLADTFDDVPFAPVGTASEQVVNLPLIFGSPVVEKYPADDRAFELEVLRLVNVERANVGLPALIEDAALTQAARRHSKDMMSSGQRGHIGSDGTSPAQRMTEEGFTGTPWTEASNFNYPTPESVLAGWLASSLHRNIILDATANRIGVGYAIGPKTQFDYAAVIDLGVIER